MIKFNFHFLDEWSGEEAFAQIDKTLIWKENYFWCEKVLPWFCKKYGINVCGNDIPDRLGYGVKAILPHEKKELALSFGTNLKKDPCLASWGVDDLEIYISD